ncbi:hypothetical protein [Neobacillus niacini]|uniref:hypothetical protein n=1 Tax=Neobacillus niacini TaxID=86668 RepID=UPI0028575A31|nr:hypothetical protein [Neobacillus niacini]MDR7000058.1 hypothetical protein [Neobacillus niacini]
MNKVLLDTGSAGTILNADVVDEICVIPEENDTVDIIRGVGGVECVYVENFEKSKFRNIEKDDQKVIKLTFGHPFIIQSFFIQIIRLNWYKPWLKALETEWFRCRKIPQCLIAVVDPNFIIPYLLKKWLFTRLHKTLEWPCILPC